MRTGIASAVTRVIVLLLIAAGAARAQTVEMETGNAASMTNLVPQMLAETLRAEGIDLRIEPNRTLTRSALRLAAGEIDAAIVPPLTFIAMSRGDGPFRTAAEQASEASQALRSLFLFPAGIYQPIVWARSDVREWPDMKGKRVFVGPPAGAANQQIEGLLRLAGDLEPFRDYEPVRLGWAAAIQAFRDGTVDVLVIALPSGAAAVDELAASRPIRILGVPPDVVASEAWNVYLRRTGQVNATLSPEAYNGPVEMDGPLDLPANPMAFAVSADMDDELAHALTRTFWDNLGAYTETIGFLDQIDPADPFRATTIPLHPGAMRYYNEAGINIPRELKPTR